MKKLRNKKGRYTRDSRLVKWFTVISGIGFAIVITMVGLTNLWDKVENSIGGIVSVKNASAEEPIPTLKDKIMKAAQDNGVNGHQLYMTAYCESRFDPGQSKVIKHGVREDSWGIYQIHLPDHRDVNRLQAQNEDFAIDWAAQHFSTVKWYAYDRINDKCVNNN